MAEQRIVQVFLDETSIIRRSPEVKQERAVAIYDLLETNQFAPLGLLKGPFHLHLRLEDHNRLVLDIRDIKDITLREVSVSLISMRQTWHAGPFITRVRMTFWND